MIISIFDKLFGKKKSTQTNLDVVAKKRIIEWIQVFMNMHRGIAYQDIGNDISFNDFLRIAEKNWKEMLNDVFSSKIMNDNDINIKQQITSDIFNYYYKSLFHEIRVISYNIVDSNFNGNELINFYNNVDELYVYLINNHSKRFKVLYNIEKYGKKIIMTELKNIVEKIIKKKLAEKFWCGDKR